MDGAAPPPSSSSGHGSDVSSFVASSASPPSRVDRAPHTVAACSDAPSCSSSSPSVSFGVNSSRTYDRDGPPSSLHADLECKYTYGHAFAGIHCPFYSFDPHGFKCVYTCEWDDKLARIIFEITGMPVFSDVEVLHKNAGLPRAAVVMGGPPCQGYSDNGYGNGIDDPSGMLFVLFGRHFRHLEWYMLPIVVMVEIVPGILNVRQGEALRMIHDELELAGFVPFDYMLDSLDYKGRAARKRLYVIAVRRDVFEVLGPVPTPTRTPRCLRSQAARHAMRHPMDRNEEFIIRNPRSRFTSRERGQLPSRVEPYVVMSTDDGDQNGIVHHADYPAGCQRALDAPGIRPSGLFYYPADPDNGIPEEVVIIPDDRDALGLQGFPPWAKHSGRRSIGNSWSCWTSEAIAVTLHHYLTRWYSYLENGYSASTSMPLSAASASALIAEHGLASEVLGDRLVKWLLDSGCSLHVITDFSRMINPRACRIPIAIGDGRAMYATYYGDADISTVDARGNPFPLTSRKSLYVERAHRPLLAQEQVISQNDLAMYVDFGGAGDRFFSTRDGRHIPILMDKGLSVLPIVPLPRRDVPPADGTEAPQPAPGPAACSGSRANVSPIASPATSIAGAFTADVSYDVDVPAADPVASPKPRSSVGLPLPQLSTRLGVSVGWILKAHAAGFPGGIVHGAHHLSGVDEARDAQLAALSGQQRRGAHADARDVRQPAVPGHFHCDYMGPVRVPSLEGATGSHEFLDLATGYAFIILVLVKGAFVAVLRRALASYVYPYIHAMLSLTTDCAKEYGYSPPGAKAEARDLLAFCKTIMLVIRYIAPRTPNHMDAERLHQTLTRIMLRLMIQAGLPEPFWGLARLYALEIYLCLPGRRATRHKGYVCSPRHAFTGAPETLAHIHPFGCLCHVLNDRASQTMRHLQRQGTACLLVGNGRVDGTDYYKLWVPNENAMRYSRNVRFHDWVFPMLDGSLLWDPGSNHASWRFPLYGHLAPANLGRVSNLRLNPALAPATYDPCTRASVVPSGYEFLRPPPRSVQGPPPAKARKTQHAAPQLAPAAPDVAGLTRLTAPAVDVAPTSPAAKSPDPLVRQRGDRSAAVSFGDGITTIDRLIQARTPCRHTGTKDSRPGSESHQRWMRYRDAANISDMYDSGATKADLAHDIRKGFIEFTDPSLQVMIASYIGDWDSYLARHEVVDPVADDVLRPGDHSSAHTLAHAFAAPQLLVPPSPQLLDAIARSTGSRLTSHRDIATALCAAWAHSESPSEPSVPEPDQAPLLGAFEAWPMLARRRSVICSTLPRHEQPPTPDDGSVSLDNSGTSPCSVPSFPLSVCSCPVKEELSGPCSFSLVLVPPVVG